MVVLGNTTLVPVKVTLPTPGSILTVAAPETFQYRVEDSPSATVGGSASNRFTTGGTIPLADGSVVEDDQGRPVISRADGGPLMDLAAGTRGVSVPLDSPNVAASLVEELTKFSDRIETEGYRLVPIWELFRRRPQ